MNKFIAIAILLLCFSCQNENDVFKTHQDYLLSEINVENTYEKSEFENYIYRKRSAYSYDTEIERVIKNYREIDSILVNTTIWNQQQLFDVRNKILFNIANKSYGRNHYTIDTFNLDLSLSHPRDTSVLNSIINTTKSLAKTLNSEQIKLSFHNYNRLGVFMIYNGSVSCGFSKIDKKIKYSNKLFYKNENAYIIPGYFEIDNYKIPEIHILKENSTDFILENGEKKNFTNPITLKASPIKGVHTVKGIIMIKQRGELIPKSFEFRYIVE